MPTDSRAVAYDKLHHQQMAQSTELAMNRNSAQMILKMLFEYVRPASVLDVGCGLGTWLAVAKEMGVADIQGVEGNWLDNSQLEIKPELVSRVDLEQGFSLGRRFDLAVCLEVGEHLFPQAADKLVNSLAQHSDLVLFSAAIPFQGGTHHVNEQFPDYWAARFAPLGYRVVDFIREKIWADRAVHWWLRQNTLLFAHDRVLAANEKLRKEQATCRVLAMVHPDMYMPRVKQMQNTLIEHQNLMKMLSTGGTFKVEQQAGGKLTINKQEDNKEPA